MPNLPLKHGVAIAAILLLLAILALLFIPRGADTQPRDLRAGDVGFSLPTQYGEMWVYGDSWYGGRFIRNAITLGGVYQGTLPSRQAGTWVWPGAPFLLHDGQVGMYGARYRQASPGMWGMQKTQTVLIQFDPRHPAGAKIQPLGNAPMWSADSLVYHGKTLLYGVDNKYQARVAWVDDQGRIIDTRNLGNWISSRYTVLQDHKKHWWMVGFLPWLSRRLVAYPMKNPTQSLGKPYRLLKTVPQPPPGWFIYDGLIHPELNGLLTWATNGKGGSGQYGLKQQKGFWPQVLMPATNSGLPKTLAAQPG